MRRTARVTIITALATATALAAAPAFANGSGQTVDMAPWQWYVAAGSGQWGIASTSYDDGLAQGSGAWNSTYMRFYNPLLDSPPTLQSAVSFGYEDFTCVSSTLTLSGDDQVVTCNETYTTTGGLAVTSEVTVLAPGDLARVTFYVTNPTESPVGLYYEYNWEYGQSTGHVRSSQPAVVQDTASDQGFLDLPDVWSYNIGGVGEAATLNAGVAWGSTGEPFIANTMLHNGSTRAFVELGLRSPDSFLRSGETVALAFFHKAQEPAVLVQEPDPFPTALSAPNVTDESAQASASTPTPASSHGAVTAASFMAEFASFSGRLTRGLPADVTVGNWQPVAVDDDTDSDAELADTGAGIDEQLLMGGIAAALLGAGAALIAIRRVSVRPARR